MRADAKRSGFRTIPSAAGTISRLVCARLREAGRELEPILRQAGMTIEQVDDPGRRVEIGAQNKLLEIAAKELDDDFLGFNLARSFELREIGVPYYVMASSPRLVDALRGAEHYSAIVSEGVRLRVRHDRATVIALDYVDVDRRSDRHQFEFWLLTLVRICRQLTGGRIVPVELKARHHRDGVPAEIRSILGCDIQFDADRDAIVFPKAVGFLPVSGADPYLNKLLIEYAEQVLSRRRRHRASTRSSIENAITELLPHGRANLSEIARRMGTSRRTLARSLAAEGVTFSKILDEFRADLAKRYLDGGGLSISQIAWLLGYREISSFSRAFQRWTGITPRKLRAMNVVPHPAAARR